MIDSTNPRIIANNIKRLFAKIIGLEAEIEAITPGSVVVPNPEGAAVANLTKVGIDGKVYGIPAYTPPSYSTTEYDTGKKWIDGRAIKGRVFILDAPLTLSTSGAWTNTGISASDISEVLDVKTYSGNPTMGMGVCFSGAAGGIVNQGFINLVNISTYNAMNVTTFIIEYVGAAPTRTTKKVSKN